MLHAHAPASAPEHVAVIMDGNRRWARERGLPIAEGYRRGVAALRAAVRAAARAGVGRITAYGFSTENWQRESQEVSLLMSLYAACARSEKPDLIRQGVRVEIIGELDAFALPARAALRDLVEGTKGGTRITLALALNYSGRSEIVRAVQAVAADVAAGALAPGDIDESLLRAKMYAPHAPDPDLLIRTGSEHRVSNFLLYQLAYTELLTLPVMWPDFDETTFVEAVRVYAERQRRYGA
ncbi:MAG TPA: polyprenyl diphosphate synthase [Candidatus Baltobacteraceae bacterium]|nr:polyprenyl diphosphate synthase [Candidatus Baltobacteraceae bacterium]